MKVEHASYEMIPRLKQIWGKCFGDLEGQGNLFFDKRFRPEHSMVLLENEEVAAMLYALPLTVCCGSIEYNARYIYAVATHPNHQNKGYSTQLLDCTNQLLQQQGVDLTVLVPASESLFDYYSKRNYKTQFFLSYSSIEAEFNNDIPLTPLPLSQLENLRNSYFADCSMFAKWDKQALKYCELDVATAKGEVLFFDIPSQGYAVCYPEADCVLIKELVGPIDCRELIGSIANRYQKNTVKIRSKPFTAQPVPYGMTCWLSKEPLIDHIEHSYLSLVLD